MPNQTQNLNQDSRQNKNQPPKKEFFSSIADKTLLAILLFAGIGAIIISGGCIIAKYAIIPPSNIALPIVDPVIEIQCEIDSDCNLVFAQLHVSYDSPEEYYKCLNISKSKAEEMYRKRKLIGGSFPDSFDEYVCICNNGKCEKVKEGLVEEVSITTDKMEYEQGEIVKIMMKNNLDKSIKHLKGVGCGLQGFSNGEWINASLESCKWDGENKLKPNLEYSFDWIASESGLEKYRIAFHYQEQKLIETKEIGRIICGESIPSELKNLLTKGNWKRNDVILYGKCNPCEACGCSCTMKNVWVVGKAMIDVTDVSCGGNSYTIKYKDKEYICVPENYKPSFGYLSPPENWSLIHSNEFTIKEKSALDLRCNEKVQLFGNCEAYFKETGYEFNSETKKCVERFIKGSGCGVKNPFKTLEECQEVCEKKSDVIFPDKDELIKCNNNGDCVLVNSSCCGCSMGGGMTCINKKYLKDWNQKLKLDCKGDIDCPAVYLCDDNPTGCECVDNVCWGVKGWEEA